MCIKNVQFKAFYCETKLGPCGTKALAALDLEAESEVSVCSGFPEVRVSAPTMVSHELMQHVSGPAGGSDEPRLQFSLSAGG